MISRELRTWLARLVRKLIIRGRSSTGYFSTEGYQSAPDEPTQNMTVKRGQHYGFVSEPPEGTECIAVAINGGASNRVSVAEWTTNEPTVDVPGNEVLVWCRNGQRILLDKDGNVIIYPKAGAKVLLGDASAGNCDQVVTLARMQQWANTFVDYYNHHTHADPVSGNTGAPNLPADELGGVAGSPDVYAKKQ